MPMLLDTAYKLHGLSPNSWDHIKRTHRSEAKHWPHPTRRADPSNSRWRQKSNFTIRY